MSVCCLWLFRRQIEGKQAGSQPIFASFQMIRAGLHWQAAFQTAIFCSGHGQNYDCQWSTDQPHWRRLGCQCHANMVAMRKFNSRTKGTLPARSNAGHSEPLHGPKTHGAEKANQRQVAIQSAPQSVDGSGTSSSAEMALAFWAADKAPPILPPNKTCSPSSFQGCASQSITYSLVTHGTCDTVIQRVLQRT